MGAMERYFRKKVNVLNYYWFSPHCFWPYNNRYWSAYRPSGDCYSGGVLLQGWQVPRSIIPSIVIGPICWIGA